MKRIFFSIVLFFIAFTINAQTDSLQEYTGKYNFPEGSPVAEIGVVIENGILTATSVMGNSELKRSESKDVFEIVSFAGLATFRRNAENKITGVLVEVQDVSMEGTKGEPAIRKFNAEKSIPGFFR